MTTKFNRKSLAFAVPGLLIQIGCGIGFGWFSDQAHAEWISNLLRVGYFGGTILLIAGLCEYADCKGRDRRWALFGAVSCLGLLILLCLDDKTKTPENTSLSPPPD
jgi:hypothetical protein